MSFESAGTTGGLPASDRGKDQEASSAPTRRFEPRTIGIFGPRNSGKTCYLSVAFFGASTSPHWTVILEDETSRDLLEAHWKAIKNGEVPPATALALYQLAGSVIISMPLPQQTSTAVDGSEPNGGTCDSASVELESPDIQKRRLPFRTRDFGGRLAERGSNGVPQLTNEFHQWLEGADCLMFFLPADQLQDPTQAEERLVEIDAILSRLIEKSLTGHAISQPISVLVTKWDLVSDLSGSLEEENQKLRQFLESCGRGLGKSVCEKIAQAGEQVKVFPVSAFGGHVDGRPRLPVKPFCVHEPLIWALQQTDRFLYKKAEREAQEFLGKRPRRVWRNYRAAIRTYQKLVDEYGISQGPLYEEIQPKLADLQAQDRRRNFRVFLVALIGVAAASLLGSCHFDQGTYIDLSARLKQPQDPYRDLERQVTRYRKSLNLWSAILGHKGQINELWDSYNDKFNQEFEDLKKLRTVALRTEPSVRRRHYEEFLNRLNDFRKKYPSSPQEPQLSGWEKDANIALSQLQFVEDIDKAIWFAKDTLAPDQEDIAPMEKALHELEARRQQSLEFPNHPDIQNRLGELEKLERQIEGEVTRYQQFDSEYKQLEDSLLTLPLEKQREQIRKFREDYSEALYPRRQRHLEKLGKKFQELSTKIDEARWKNVQETFEAFRKLAEKFPHGVGLDGIEQSFGNFLRIAREYREAKDPYPNYIDKVKELEDAGYAMLDDALWRDVTIFSQENSKDFERIAHRAYQYLHEYDFLPADKQEYREDAEGMLRQAIRDRWKELYAALYERVQFIDNLAKLIEAQKKAEEFLEWATKTAPTRFKAYVPEEKNYQNKISKSQEWLNWTRTNLGPEEKPKVSIVVTNIPDNREVWLTVFCDNKEIRKTEWLSEGEQAFVELSPGVDYRTRNALLRVDVTIYNWWLSPDTTASVGFELPWAFFGGGVREKSIKFPGWEDQPTNTIVRIDCKELTPPPLDKPY